MPDGLTIENELRCGRSVIVNTKGYSMRPLLWQGRTQVVISPIKNPLKIGDLPLVRIKDGLSRLHRVIKIDKNTIYTRGDNCIGIEKVDSSDVLGVVTEIYKGKKKIDIFGKGYKFYVRFWLWSSPMRIFIFKIRAFIFSFGGKVKRFAKKIFKKSK